LKENEAGGILSVTPCPSSLWRKSEAEEGAGEEEGEAREEDEDILDKV
jgi:hypothetical protein